MGYFYFYCTQEASQLRDSLPALFSFQEVAA